MTSDTSMMLILFFGSSVVFIVGSAAYLYYFRVWFRASAAGVPVPLKRVVGMTFIGVSPYKVVLSYVDAANAGLELTLDELEARASAKIDVRSAVRQVLRSKDSGEELSFDEVCERLRPRSN